MTIKEYASLNEEYVQAFKHQNANAPKLFEQLKQNLDDELKTACKQLSDEIINHPDFKISQTDFKALLTVLDRAYRLSYVNDHNEQVNLSIIDDTQYDWLERRYESKYGSFKGNDDLSAQLKQVKLPIHAYSLKKALPEALGVNEQLDKYLKSMQKINPHAKYVVQQKLDGSHFIAQYQNGRLILLASRGDGEVGNDLTYKASYLKNLPLTVNEQHPFVIEGEILMRKSVAKQVGLITRNGANTFATQKDVAILQKLQLFALSYNVHWLHDDNRVSHFTTQVELLTFLKEQGFLTFDDLKLYSAQEVLQKVKELELNKENYDFDVDGTVIKPNDIAQFEQLGYTNKAPKFEIACKFVDPILQTVLTDITPTVGRTGKIGFIGKLVPVNFNGVMISNVTLNNLDYIHDLHLQLGSIVQLKRSGGVIPKLVGVLKNVQDEGYQTLLHQTLNNSMLDDTQKVAVEQVCSNLKPDPYTIQVCPVCKQELSIKKNTLVCTNEKCMGRFSSTLSYFVNEGLNWRGIGDKIVSDIAQTLYEHDDFNIVQMLWWDASTWTQFTSSIKIAQKIVHNKEQILKNLTLLDLMVACGFSTKNEMSDIVATVPHLIPKPWMLPFISANIDPNTVNINTIEKIANGYFTSKQALSKENFINTFISSKKYFEKFLNMLHSAALIR